MQYTINQLYQDIYQRVFDIRDTFNTFFGEEFVDLQLHRIKESTMILIEAYLTAHNVSSSTDSDGNILYDVSSSVLRSLKNSYNNEKAIIYVWWPQVTVTNENDKSIEIQDLYAKIDITIEGRIPYENRGFLLNRATYNSIQFASNYLHSHIQIIPKNDFTLFMVPCLGTGPINGTIGSLKNEYDEAIWMLFCQELSMYVTIESLRGGPWKRLESVGDNERSYFNTYKLERGNKNVFTTQFSNTSLKEFIAYYLQHGHLSLSYKDNFFVPGMTYFEYIIDVSNSFIDFYNEYLKSTSAKIEELFRYEVLLSVVINNGKFFRKLNDTTYVRNLDLYRNKHVLTFKGRDIRTTITESAHVDTASTTIINYNLAMYILANILKIINFRYKNGHNNNNQGDSAEASTVNQKVYYI